MFRSTTFQLTSNSCAAVYLLVLLAFPMLPAVASAGAVHLSDHAAGTLGQEFGGSVCGLGDVNGDGRDDILIGAPGESNTGAAFLWFGNPAVTHSAAKAWYGVADEKFGFSVAAIGDVNNDGDPDFAVGAPLANSPGADSGRICIFYGGSSLSSTPDLVIGGQVGGDQFGFSIAAAGDFNGDGKDDFIVGAPYYSASGIDIGAAYIIYGQNGGPSSDLTDATILIGEIAGDNFGWSVSGAGNFMGGNEESVAVGAPHSDSHGGTDAGAVFVYEGSVPPSNPNSTTDHILSIGGTAPTSRYGWVVRNAGRWDSDSYDDLAVGAPTHNVPGTDAGRVEIIYGDPNPASTGDRYVTGANGGDQLGFSLDNLGDFTGNNKDDLLIGAPYLVDAGVDAGRAYIFEGGSTSGGASGLIARAVDPMVPGNNADNKFGFSVAGLGDFDGDGFKDYAVSAPGGQIGNDSRAGYCLMQASDTQTVASAGYQGHSSWTAQGQVDLQLVLPFAPQEIQNLEIRRLPDTTVHNGPVQNLIQDGNYADRWFRYQLLDEGPFGQNGSPEQVAYEAIIQLNTGGIIHFSDPAAWQPLMLDAQPAMMLLMTKRAWPNPANPRTALEYSVARGEYFRLTIRDLRGHQVRSLNEGTGTGEWVTSVWDGKNNKGLTVSSGLYFFELRSGRNQEVRKVILAR